MPGFRFKLDTVLRHRERIEQDRQRDLALSLAEQSAIQEQIRRLDQSVQSSTADLRTNHLIGPIDLAYLTAHRRFVLGMQRQGVALLTQLREHDAKVAAARSVLAEATRERKVLEQLRENTLAKWKQVFARREAADLDEVAMQMSFKPAVDSAAASTDEVPS